MITLTNQLSYKLKKINKKLIKSLSNYQVLHPYDLMYIAHVYSHDIIIS